MSRFDTTKYFTEACLEHGTAISYQIKQKLCSEQTPFQRIEIYETTTHGNLMVIDGFVMLTQRDNFFYHEMMSHPALFTHPNPEQVLIIGGGDCGTLQQVLQHHSVKQATQVDIDEQVTRLAERYFPELCTHNNDPRATLRFDDGIQWIQQQAAQSLDIIIIDSTDPVGPGEGLFTSEFYRHCLHALKPEGLIVHQSESPFFHQALIKKMHHAMHEAGFNQTQLITYPQPCYPSGYWSATLASTTLPLTQFRKEAADAKSFSTKYYNTDIHQGALACPEFMKT